MLQELSVKNFTVFAVADFRFCNGLNLIVGENGAGKTHVLKLAYSIAHSLSDNRHKGFAPVGAPLFSACIIQQRELSFNKVNP